MKLSVQYMSFSAHADAKGIMQLIRQVRLSSREFKKLLRRRRRQRRLKNELKFYRDTLKSLTLFITVKVIAKLNLGHLTKFEIEF